MTKIEVGQAGTDNLSAYVPVESEQAEKGHVLSLDAFIRSIGVQRSPVALFLGAGASTTSGVPSAEMCIWEWKRQIFLTNNPGLEDQFAELSLEGVRRKIQHWLDRQGGYPKEHTSKEYGFYIKRCFPITSDRSAFFSKRFGMLIPMSVTDCFVISPRPSWSTRYGRPISMAFRLALRPGARLPCGKSGSTAKAEYPERPVLNSCSSPVRSPRSAAEDPVRRSEQTSHACSPRLQAWLAIAAAAAPPPRAATYRRVGIPLWKTPPATDPRTTALSIGHLAGSCRHQETRRLLDLGAGVGVDLQPDRDLNDYRRPPLHGHFLRSDPCRRQGRITAEGCQPR
jgi:hypothetical protein